MNEVEQSVMEYQGLVEFEKGEVGQTGTPRLCVGLCAYFGRISTHFLRFFVEFLVFDQTSGRTIAVISG